MAAVDGSFDSPTEGCLPASQVFRLVFTPSTFGGVIPAATWDRPSPYSWRYNDPEGGFVTCERLITSPAGACAANSQG